jgi:putative ABC transport system permease protein
VTVSIAALGTAASCWPAALRFTPTSRWRRARRAATGHLIVGLPAQFSKDEDTPLQHTGMDQHAELKALLADPDVRQVLPRVAFSGLISNGDKSTIMLATGRRTRQRICRQGPLL